MARVAVIGGGLAGMAAAAALGQTGFDVELFETRGFLGGRATSYPAPGSSDESDLIDNCQHVLLPCCVNLLDLYQRLGVRSLIEFHREIPFIEPGGRISRLVPGRLPAPLHFTGSFLAMRCLELADKRAVARALLALRRQRGRADLDRITMLDWLREQRQTPRAIERFWRQMLVSAVNEELDRMAAAHGFQVFWLGFLAHADAASIGLPAAPLSQLYGTEAWGRMARVRMRLRCGVERIVVEGSRASALEAGGELHQADHFVCAAPFERVPALAPELALDFTGWQHSPITGIHLWFDRAVTDLPYATLLDRTMQWFFNKSGGRYLQLVVSASRRLAAMGRDEIVALARAELPEFLPAAGAARLERAHVVKEVRATFSAAPGLESRRPAARTRISNLFLAGDWTRSGWPATMEGAVRSGYLAAEAVAEAAGRPAKFLLPDVA